VSSLEDVESYWAVFRPILSDASSRFAGINANRTCILVMQSELKRAGSSLYVSECPVCNIGTLHCQRKSGYLINYDRCILCAQTFKYRDEEIGGEFVHEPREVPP
jgi:hypothetical protein